MIQRPLRLLASHRIPAAAVLFLMLHAPFLGQAFHMDDAIYLILARNVFSNPAFPQDTGVHVEGIWADDLASMEHPPLTAYLLAAGAFLAGGFSEAPLHALFLVFPVILGVSMYSLSRRFTHHPLAATALLLSTPLVFVTSHTLMTDLPHLALWMLALALFTRGADEGNDARVWGGAAAAAVASLVSPAALSLVPLMALYAVLRKKSRYCVPAVLIPVLAGGIWLMANWMHYGRLTPAFTLQYYFASEQVLAPQALLRKSLYALPAVGGLTLSPVILLSSSYRKYLALGLPLAMAAATLSEARSYPLPSLFLFTLLFALGFAAILGSLPGVFEKGGPVRLRSDEAFLSVWLLGALSLAVLFYMTGSARYLLPAVPPLVLLAVRRLEAEWTAARLRLAGAAAVLAGCLVSVSLAAADYEFAEVYRKFGSHLNAMPDPASCRIWFTGEWGLRAYLEKIGGEELGRRDARPRPGDRLVVPELALPYSTLFDNNVSHQSIVMVAPSRIDFEVPALPQPATLFLLVGMPGWKQSDGLEFSVQWGEQVLFSQGLVPSRGRIWSPVEIALPATGGAVATLALSAQVGASGNADADWVAISHARIRTADGPIEQVCFNLREHLLDAKISAVPQQDYHTPGNRPVLDMAVWLDQEPATRVLDVYRFTPWLPLRLLDGRSHAGFWSMGWGLLPFSLASDRAPLEEIRVLEITRSVDSFDERAPTWYPSPGHRHPALASGAKER